MAAAPQEPVEPRGKTTAWTGKTQMAKRGVRPSVFRGGARVLCPLLTSSQKRMFRDMNMGGQTLEQPFCIWENLPGEVPTAPSLSEVKGCLGNVFNDIFQVLASPEVALE